MKRDAQVPSAVVGNHLNCLVSSRASNNSHHHFCSKEGFVFDRPTESDMLTITLRNGRRGFIQRRALTRDNMMLNRIPLSTDGLLGRPMREIEKEAENFKISSIAAKSSEVKNVRFSSSSFLNTVS